MRSLNKVNEILTVENKIAVSLVIKGNNPNESSPTSTNDEKVNQLVNTIQYIIDCNNDDSSTNKFSDSLDHQYEIQPSEENFTNNIQKRKREILE
mmetsp:Transcript_26518/g.23440  ORF Transcript_26518/g.23440 Transcript_26518/m.23440 type:complete len:95 (+) Transcript_26518:490-774(+)